MALMMVDGECCVKMHCDVVLLGFMLGLFFETKVMIADGDEEPKRALILCNGPRRSSCHAELP